MKHKLLKALQLAIQGKWDDAHKTVQDMKNEYAYWIHANLHREEGDISNSMYWYRRANKTFTEIDTMTERNLIRNDIEKYIR